MIYFRKREVDFSSVPKDEIEKLINEKCSKINFNFDFTQTLGYIIIEERPFAGKKLKNGDVIISRYRHTIFSLSPRIVTNWKVESKNDNCVLITKTRLSLLSTIGFLILSLGIIVPTIIALLELKFPTSHDVSYGPFILIGIFAALTYYEIRTTEQMMDKIIRREKIKNVFSA